MEVRIYYEDTDCGGVVYHANYLKYFERARTQYLEGHGISIRRLLEDGTQFMVIHAEVTYRAPARYGDTLAIETWLSERTKARLTFSHIVRERASRRVVADGAATLAAVNREGKLTRLPEPLLRLHQEVRRETGWRRSRHG
jgi:acyl-CoA thioester hydrolase